MVGWALNSSIGLDDVPAHRVVNRNGQLSGKMHFSHPCEMEALLKEEGIKVEKDTVVDFKNLFWDPRNNLH